MRSWSLVLGASGIVAVLSVAPARGECALPLTGFQARGEIVGVLADESVAPEIVDQAIALWRGCANYGGGFPSFTTGVQAGRTVTVRTERRPRGIGKHYCGTFLGSRITLYQYWVDAAGIPRRCGSLAHNLAHELGHVLGLDDAPSGSSCGATIMAPLTARNQGSRAVTAEVCQLAGQKWLTPSEAVLADAIGDTAPFRFVHARLQ